MKCLLLRDPIGVAASPAVLPMELVPIVSRLDGAHSLRAILLEGSLVRLTEDVLCAVVQGLDQLCYLDNEKTRRQMEQLKSDYHNQPLRHPVLAGRAYPDDAVKLHEVISDYIRRSETMDIPEQDRGRIVAIASPHIDYQRGWQTYGAVYSALQQTRRPHIVFLFGTAHHGGSSLFQLTGKDFAMPSAVVPVARDVVEQLARVYGEERSFTDELMHRGEHSLELQLPFIIQRFKDEGLPLVVPILVGSFHNFVLTGKMPMDSPDVSEFVEAVAESVKKLMGEGLGVLLYAGIDLAHVGLHFGDTQRVSDEGLESLRHWDMGLLGCVDSADASALFAYVARDQDNRRVCGYPALYTMFSVMQRAGWRVRGTCLDYRQAVEAESDCVVSFAGAYWVPEERPNSPL
jgi:MEMO1 family protein